jgi:hypothetical protein
MQKLTSDKLMEEMWCRGLDYDNLLYYASEHKVSPMPTEVQYEAYCNNQRNREMDLFFKECDLVHAEDSIYDLPHTY